MVVEGRRTVLAKDLIVVPTNVGPRIMPDYKALAVQGIDDMSNGMQVFARKRDHPYYIDLGAIFDTLNLRPAAMGGGRGGVDMLSRFNMHTIAIEVPAKLSTQDGKKRTKT